MTSHAAPGCCLIAVLLASSSTAAKPPKGPPAKAAWVVLVHADSEVPSSWSEGLRSAAQDAQDRAWVPPPAVTLDEVQLVLGCGRWGIACAAEVASMTHADNALVVGVTRVGAGATVTIEAVAKDGRLVAQSESVNVAAVDDDGLRIAEAWVAGAVKGARPTVLIVSADLEGTEVVVDNVPRGRTPLTLIDEVVAGEHVLLLRREGRAPLSRTIDVAAGVLNREHGVLSSGGPPMKAEPVVGVVASPPPPAGGPMVLVGWGLTGLGASAAFLVGTVAVFWQIEVADYSANVVDDKINIEYQRTLGPPVTGPDRAAFLLATFGNDGADGNELKAAVSDRQNAAALCFVVAGIGALVAGTGAALALGSAPDEDASAAGIRH